MPVRQDGRLVIIAQGEVFAASVEFALPGFRFGDDEAVR